MTGTRTRLLPLVAMVAALTGCIPDGLAFRQDHRLSIHTPADRSEVVLPFEVRWDFDGARPAETRFAVLVDRFPPRPGQSIEALLPAELREPARCDADCRRTALESRNVFVTEGTSLEITKLAVRHGVSDEQRRRHEISIVVLDDDLRRVGETVVWVEVDQASSTVAGA